MTTHANLGHGQERLLKVLSATGRSPYRRGVKWSLPTARKPGAWQPALQGKPEHCERGYHGTTAGHLGSWLESNKWRVFVAEVDGPVRTRTDWGVQSKWVTTAPVRLLYELPLDGDVARWLALDLWAAQPAHTFHDGNVTPAFEWASTGKGALPWNWSRSVRNVLVDQLVLTRGGASAAPCKRWWAL